MRCPFCGAPDTRVIDSRLGGQGDSVRRRRECLGCGARFTTFENAEFQLPRVVKQDGSREPFNRDKLRAGMQRALQKRPVATEQVEEALNRLIRQAHDATEREIPSRRIGDWVMSELRQLDEVAYVRFASVYRHFQDVNAFREEIERLQQAAAPPAKPTDNGTAAEG